MGYAIIIMVFMDIMPLAVSFCVRKKKQSAGAVTAADTAR